MRAVQIQRSSRQKTPPHVEHRKIHQEQSVVADENEIGIKRVDGVVECVGCTDELVEQRNGEMGLKAEAEEVVVGKRMSARKWR
ncbi:hypothetical protein M5689_010934 [Euphorbia peplus]|nr:hypothetical protein M5689_010934 [Euphorbia peplus]